MATLPVTGTAISFGQVNQAFTNKTPGSVVDSPGGGRNIKLSAALGVNFGGKVLGAPVSLSGTFGGKITPYGY